MSDLLIDEVVWLEAGKGITARGKIPENSEFFQDHFPDFPVLPGVLALEMLKRTAEHYLQAVHQASEEHHYLKQIRATKFHTYLKPGDEWESQLELVSSTGEESHWNARLFHEGKVAVSAKLVLSLSHRQQQSVSKEEKA